MSGAFDPYYQWLGIPKHEQPPDFYRLLGLTRFEPNPDVIESTADRQMAHVRNHQTGKHAADSQKVLNEISAARLCPLNPQKKADYDARLKAQSARPIQQPAPKEPLGKAVPATGAKGPTSSPSHGHAQPHQKQQGGSSLLLIVLVLAGGAALLLLVAGVGAAYLLWPKADDSPVVQVKPVPAPPPNVRPPRPNRPPDRPSGPVRPRPVRPVPNDPPAQPPTAAIEVPPTGPLRPTADPDGIAADPAA